MFRSRSQDKKASLAPMVESLKETRQKTQNIEYAHQEKRKQYDQAMMGIDGYFIIA
jgi:hypothetical protein